MELKTDWFVVHITKNGEAVWIDGHSGYSTADALAFPLERLDELVHLLSALSELVKAT